MAECTLVNLSQMALFSQTDRLNKSGLENAKMSCQIYLGGH